MFGIDYFGRPAFLAQSPQFYKQALVGVFERVYEVGPVFRAEPHDTARHLTQYTSLDAELGFITDHHDVMAVLRDAVAGMTAAAADQAAAALALLELRLPTVPDQIPEIHFTDAQDLLARHTGEDPRGEPDLAPAHERWLSNWAAREHGSEFLFVTGYPMTKRPFYTHPDPARPAHSNSFDLLFRGLELVTGGQRLHRHADYLTALAARGEDPDTYRATSTPSPTACHPTEDSRSAWNAGPPASPARPTSAKPPCSPATSTGSHPDPPLHPSFSRSVTPSTGTYAEPEGQSPTGADTPHKESSHSNRHDAWDSWRPSTLTTPRSGHSPGHTGGGRTQASGAPRRYGG